MTITLPNMLSSAPRVRLAYTVEPRDGEWELPEGTVPESIPHSEASDYLSAVLRARFAAEPSTRVARSLAIRWNRQRPQDGVDPDVCLLRPAPDNADDLLSLKLWEPGGQPPVLSVEVVSKNHPHKDYARLQEAHSYTRVRELLVHDPRRYGPRSMGGPQLLHLWRRRDDGQFVREHFGNGPAFSEVLCAWLISDGDRLRVADEQDGSGRWLTAEERLLRRVDQLEAELARK